MEAGFYQQTANPVFYQEFKLSWSCIHAVDISCLLLTNYMSFLVRLCMAELSQFWLS